MDRITFIKYHYQFRVFPLNNMVVQDKVSGKPAAKFTYNLLLILRCKKCLYAQICS